MEKARCTAANLGSIEATSSAGSFDFVFLCHCVRQKESLDVVIGDKVGAGTLLLNSSIVVSLASRFSAHTEL